MSGRGPRVIRACSAYDERNTHAAPLRGQVDLLLAYDGNGGPVDRVRLSDYEAISLAEQLLRAVHNTWSHAEQASSAR